MSQSSIGFYITEKNLIDINGLINIYMFLGCKVVNELDFGGLPGIA